MKKHKIPFYTFRYKVAHVLTLIAPKIVNLTLRKTSWKYSIQDYRKFPEGTVAKEISYYLDYRNLSFLPKGEKHDVRHIVLGYEMTVEGEVRMQAFLLGNGKLHLFGVAYLLFFMALMPELIEKCMADYLRGKQALSIREVDEVSLLGMSLEEAKKHFSISEQIAVEVQLY